MCEPIHFIAHPPLNPSCINLTTTQVAYLATFRNYDSFVLMNLGFTLLMMLYDVIAKVLR